jgi:arabinose-5-phosphate isomerase
MISSAAIARALLAIDIGSFDNNIFNQTAEFLMSKDPISIASNALAIAALEIMEEHNITSLFVYSSPGLSKPDGIVHIHDILKTGVQ